MSGSNEVSVLEVFLAPRGGGPEASPQSLQPLVAQVAELGGVEQVRGVWHDPSALGGLAHGDETADAPAYIALLHVRLDEGGPSPGTIRGLAAALATAESFDLAHSSVVAGVERTIVPGVEPLMLAMALHRKDGYTRSGFLNYWGDRHAELGRRVPGSQGYAQVHPLDADDVDGETVDRETVDRETVERGIVGRRLGCGGPSYDGVALAYYRDDAAFAAIMANEAVVGPLLEDEQRFIDHSRSAMVVGWAVGS